MSFHRFTLSTLPAEAPDAYALEVITADAKLGVALTNDEVEMLADALSRAADGELDEFGEAPSEYADS